MGGIDTKPHSKDFRDNREAAVTAAIFLPAI
jgi:hypothetical protein